MIVLVALAMASAHADDVLILDDGTEIKNSMTWPMLPGESLNELAAKFYPKNKVMQRHFTTKALFLNAETLPNLNADVDFAVPTAVVIPTLKSLSSHAGTLKSSHEKSGKQKLHMSYNMKSAVENLPRSLVKEYENLVTRNTFLKEELAKLNEKLVFLQSKLNDLKLILDKTISLPQKKVFKNLDEKNTKDNPEIKASHLHVQAPSLISSIFESINKDLLWVALGLGLVAGLISFVLKKYRESRYKKFVIQTERDALTPSFVSGELKEEFGDKVKSKLLLNTDTQVDDLNERSILDEAKFLMSKNQPAEAIEHIKWAIRAQPKTAINLWLYLLDIFRQEQQKDDFENYAKAMHQTFNVMTPMWEEKNVAIIVAQALEEFPHIVERLTASWPSEEARIYLRSLITDNRNGERTGFGKAVLDEILLLIAVLEARSDFN